MRIDVHAHYWTEDYLQMLTELGSTGTDVARGLGAGGGAELQARLRPMDRAGGADAGAVRLPADAVRRGCGEGGPGG